VQKLDAAVMMRWNMWRVTWQLPLLFASPLR
jgi:hypothetical protein